MSDIPPTADAKETLSAIATFEQILDAFPDDIATLEALCQAHDSLGHSEAALSYLVRTAQAMERQPGAVPPAALVDRLQAAAPGDPEAARLAGLLRDRSGPSAAPPPERARSRAMEAEMALAWKLKEENRLPERDYALLIQDLSEISATGRSTTLSLLHVMNDRGIANFEGILAHLARDSGMGILPIASFEPNPELLALLPADYMLRQGVAIFDQVGAEPLAAVLNPYNESLKREVEARVGRKCHFYLAHPAEFDAFIARIRDPGA